MARPDRKTKETRTESVIYRLTKTEMRSLKKEARTARMQPNNYARLKATSGVVVLRQVRELPFEVVYELGRIGNNINQISRRLNATDLYNAPELAQVCAHLDELLYAILADISD